MPFVSVPKLMTSLPSAAAPTLGQVPIGAVVGSLAKCAHAPLIAFERSTSPASLGAIVVLRLVKTIGISEE